jgi:hypothetical protein
VLHAANVDTHAEVLGAKADAVADACGFSQLGDTIRVWQRRQNDPQMATEEDEESLRDQVLMEESRERDQLEQLRTDGVVQIDVVFRSGHTRAEHNLTVPRYTSCRTLTAIIEEKIGERVVVSFTAPVRELAEVNQSPLLRLSGALPLKCLEVNSDSDDPASAADAQRTLALKPRTVAMFLHLRKPRCTARPLGGTPALSMTPDPSHSSIARRMREINASQMDRSDRVASLKQLVADEERSIIAPSPLMDTSSKRPTRQAAKAALDAEGEEHLVNRLYGYSVKTMKDRKEEQDAYLAQGEQLLWRRRKVGEPSEEQAESVERLYAGGQASKVRAIEKAVEQQEVRVVRAKTVERSEEEIAAASLRLYQSAKGKQDAIQRLATKVYGEDEDKRLTQSDLSRLVASVYTEAVDRKARAREKAAASTTDFKALSSKKKLSKEQLASMSDRLCKK